MPALSPLAALLGICRVEDETAIWESIWRELQWDLLQTQHVQKLFLHYCQKGRRENLSSTPNRKVEKCLNKTPFSLSDWFLFFVQRPPVIRSMSIETAIEDERNDKSKAPDLLDSFTPSSIGDSSNDVMKLFIDSVALESFFSHYGIPGSVRDDVSSLSEALTGSDVVDSHQVCYN